MLRRTFAPVVGVMLSITSCSSSSTSSTSTTSVRVLAPAVAGIGDLRAARQRWAELGPTTYRMTVTTGGMMGSISCRFDVTAGAGTLTSVAGTADPATIDHICGSMGSTLPGRFDDVEAILRGSDGVIVAYDERGVPVHTQFPGDPATDGGGVIVVDVIE